MSLVLASLVGVTLAATGVSDDPWATHYGTARDEARRLGKPLLVVIEEPGRETTRRHRAGLAGSLLSRLLSHYRLCRIDAGTPYGRKMARAFDAGEFPFTAVIDKTGEKQIFRKAGAFSPEEWHATLASFQEGKAPAGGVSVRRSRSKICFT
jgi:hypothetical protein